MERVGLVDCVDPVEDSVSIELIDEERVFGIDPNSLHC